MTTKSRNTADATARAAGKADRARDGARAMQEYVERRAHAVAKMKRLRTLREAQENAAGNPKKADAPAKKVDAKS
jgi:hypothetical protein